MGKLKAIYGRQSKDKKDSLSVPAQINRGIEYCKNHDFEYCIYDEDKGYSAGNTKRPRLPKNDV